MKAMGELKGRFIVICCAFRASSNSVIHNAFYGGRWESRVLLLKCGRDGRTVEGGLS